LAWWHTSVIPAVRRLRQEHLEFQVYMGCTTKPCMKHIKFSLICIQIITIWYHYFGYQQVTMNQVIFQCSFIYHIDCKDSQSACNPRHLGGRDWEDSGSRSPLAKKISETPISTNKPDVVVGTCDPSYTRGHR
jgi:hypothetical protein